MFLMTYFAKVIYINIYNFKICLIRYSPVTNQIIDKSQQITSDDFSAPQM